MKNYKFVDVSHHKGDLDHQKFADVGVRLEIAKASDSYHMPDINGRYDFTLNRHYDARFIQNFVGARSVGLIVGHYHFGRVDRPRGQLTKVAANNLKDYLVALNMLPQEIKASCDIFATGILDMEQPSSQINAAGLSKETVSGLVKDTVLAFKEVFGLVILYSGSWWTDAWMLDKDLEEIAKVAGVWEPEYAHQFASSEGYVKHPDGYNTPPVGLNLFVASSRFDQPVVKLYRATFPFLLLLILTLVLITYWPALSLFLPGLFMG